MKERTTLLVSNHWHKPGITMKVVHCPVQAPEGAIMLELELADFRQALLAELPSSLQIWTRAQMAAAMETAMAIVVEKMKTSTIGAL